MNLTYGIKDKPQFKHMLVFAFQQVLAILAATILVPALINGACPGANMSQAAALFGAGVGTIIYQLFTKFRSPVFLGSSFAFIGSMIVTFAGAASVALGYLGLVIGAVLAGLVYVVISCVVRVAGTGWVSKIMPAVVIGPTGAIIGLSLAGNAIGNLVSGTYSADASAYVFDLTTGLHILCGLVALAVVMLCSVFGKKMAKLIPFIIGILSGYVLASLITLIGKVAGVEAMVIMDYSAFTSLFKEITLSSFVQIPEFTFIKALGGFSDFNLAYVGTVAIAYVPVAFVVFAEHIADHKNLSTIIGQDLISDPGLNNTLLGDGVGSMAGAFFGGCPNTTYGESVACVAITKNASVATITTAAVMCMLMSFFSPFVAFLSTIPTYVMGGICVSLYGFIAVSGLKMLQPVDLNDNRNLFVAAVILVSGVGGLAITFGQVTLTTAACSLILGILTNTMLSKKKAAE